MTDEQAIAILERGTTIPGDGVTWEQTQEATARAVSALRAGHHVDANKMVPLTFEQLRGMAGNPYWHVGLQDDSPKPHWKILDQFVAQHPEDYGYGKRWTAYAYPTAHIDRDAWKPCESCLSCDNCENNGDYNPDEGIYGECGPCYGYSNFKPANFCRECGKPLTPEAWAELEKRIKGGELYGT